jgi:hypothetical protein
MAQPHRKLREQRGLSGSRRCTYDNLCRFLTDRGSDEPFASDGEAAEPWLRPPPARLHLRSVTRPNIVGYPTTTGGRAHLTRHGRCRSAGKRRDSASSEEVASLRYRFLLEGRLSSVVVAAFPELAVVDADADTTTMAGELHDYAQLRGILARFDDFAVAVVEMTRVAA